MTGHRNRAGLVALMAMAFSVCADAARATPQLMQRAGENNPSGTLYTGLLLADALRVLQARGLRLVFTSQIVTRDMRVVAEPRATRPIEILDELLKPHGLRIEQGPGGVLQVVRGTPPVSIDSRKQQPAPVKAKAPLAPAIRPAYAENVSVIAARSDDASRGGGSQTILAREDLKNLRGVLADDPVRALQSLPRAAAADDFRSELSVRGSPYRHIGVVVDGVATPWLQHAAYGRGDAGSIAMFGSEVLDEATLRAGAYPQQYGDWLGAQVALTMRQGSRTNTQYRGAFSGTMASVVAEGPLGRAQRGSWLFAVRHSFLDWPARRRNVLDGTVFGFGDAQAKFVYDVRPGHQVSVAMLGGRSGVDGPDAGAPDALANGMNRAGMVNIRWDATFGPHARLTQQTYLVSHQFVDKRQTGQDNVRGANEELSYRVDLIRALPQGLLEVGGQLRRSSSFREEPRYGSPAASGRLALHSIDRVDGLTYLRSGFVNFTWRPIERLTLVPGLRVSDSSRAQRATVGRWIVGQWAIRNGWTLNASTGVSHQFPGFDQTFVTSFDSHDLALAQYRPGPERSVHAEIGIAQRLGGSVRWQATVFQRRERDVLREPVVFDRVPEAQYENALTGSSRGVELLVERRRVSGFSGWASYSYGKSRYADRLRDEIFWADFDQRHALNLHLHYALSGRTTAALTFRGGSNFPIPGYLAADGEKLFAGTQRNAVRLPPYARLDVRAERTFEIVARRVTLFFEVVNVLNRNNLGVAHGIIRPGTREALGLTQSLFPRLPSAGVRIEF